MDVNYYKGLGRFYFRSVISNIIKIGNLDKTEKVILDFGCGSKILSKEIRGKKILNYDKNPQYTDHKDYKNLNFDIVVLNHVLMYMDEKEIELTFNTIRKINEKCEFIIGIGKGGFLNKLAAVLSFNFTAHHGTLSSYTQQVKIIKEQMEILKVKKNIFFMTDIYYVNFKPKVNLHN